MIKFFRKIRQKLLTENKVSKYLLYAIGEIILVMIGILMALQINNKNELRKTENKILSILKEVQKDLAKDIETSDELVAYYKRKDSIIDLILTNKLTYEDYKTDSIWQLKNIITDAFHMKIHNNGYTNLIANIDNIPENLKEIVDPLNEIYINYKYEIDKFDKRLDLITDRQMDYLAANHDWYHNHFNGPMSDSAINYYLNTFHFKSAADIYQNAGCHNLSTNVRLFRMKALQVYKQINRLTDNHEKLPHYFEFYDKISLSSEEMQEYVGTYELMNIDDIEGFKPNVKITFSIENGVLKMTRIRDLTNNNTILFKAKDQAFHEDNQYITLKFMRNENNEITDLKINRVRDLAFKKIE